MLKHKDHFHGSDLEKIEDIYGIKKEDITSFFCQCKSTWNFPSFKGYSFQACRRYHFLS